MSRRIPTVRALARRIDTWLDRYDPELPAHVPAHLRGAGLREPGRGFGN
ncbi:MAG TPA: hypothetical protein VGP02_03610 [Mycobacteriales bacterium]|jgi:hypothetical protein|nr:hypothetical protein [Mycobacteriales bacterium]